MVPPGVQWPHFIDEKTETQGGEMTYLLPAKQPQFPLCYMRGKMLFILYLIFILVTILKGKSFYTYFTEVKTEA